MEPIIFSPIREGQYTVEMNLNDLMKEEKYKLREFELQLIELLQKEKDYNAISSIKNGILKYKSETLLPHRDDGDRQKLLFVFGNPAIHSVTNGMFFFSNKVGDRHNMWGKLDIADVVAKVKSKNPISVDARMEEAKERKMMLQEGNKSMQYLVGLTTFYSFPTSIDGGVNEVERLFAPIIDKVNEQEVKRILGYEFSNDARLIFVQKSSYEVFRTYPEARNLDTIFWPIRGKGSSGENLKKLLQE
jgi:hypothetical protein